MNQNVFILNPNHNAIELQDALDERLSKANSLIQFALTESFIDHFNEDMRNYIWTLSQLLEEAYELNLEIAKRYQS